MGKKFLWLVVSSLMTLSLVMAACGPAAVEEKPTTPAVQEKPATPTTPTKSVEEPTQKEAVTPKAEVPKYGGTLRLAQTGSQTNWKDGHLVSWNFLYDTLFGGDWTKGPAGGFGTNESDWTSNYDRFDHYQGWVAKSWDWTIDAKTGEVTITYPIRQGLHYHIIPGSKASQLVGGRELTADDVVFTLKWLLEPTNYIYVTVPELRTAKITKSGPWEVTVKFASAEQIMPALTNFNGKYSLIRPPELFKQYGTIDRWDLQIGTGPFMLLDNVPDSHATIIKNPNYWAKDPIGPGKGNQLPYIDGVQYLIIPDLSTRQAALRTGKIDQMFPFTLEDADQMRRTTPQLKELEYYQWTTTYPSIHMRVDIAPFNDIRLRHAMMYATDFEAIRKGLNQGKGIIQSYPFMYNKAYADLWIAEDDPVMPERVKDLYIYNPIKAKQLLKEAGYPDGFKVAVLATSGQVDYLSVLIDMWAKVGVKLELMVRESAVRNNLLNTAQHPPMATGSSNSVGRFYQPWTLTGDPSTWHISAIKDPVLNKGLDEIRLLARTDLTGAMKLMRNLTKDHILYQAYAIPAPAAPSVVFWWPWLKNYNGELIMTLGTYTRWAQWTWLDQDLKKSMGY